MKQAVILRVCVWCFILSRAHKKFFENTNPESVSKRFPLLKRITSVFVCCVIKVLISSIQVKRQVAMLEQMRHSGIGSLRDVINTGIIKTALSVSEAAIYFSVSIRMESHRFDGCGAGKQMAVTLRPETNEIVTSWFWG